MKITSIESCVVNASLRNWIFVRVETDQPGLYGWGEATLEWKTRAVVGAIEDLKPLLLGRDPRDIEALVRLMHKGGFWRLGVIGSSAISGIELALWDIWGKSLDMPVWRLLGGRVRDRVRCYTHLGMGQSEDVYGGTDAGRIADRARAVVARGYDALKIVNIPYTHMAPTNDDLKRTAAVADAVRDAVGDAVDVMFDFHGRPGTVAAARALIDACKGARPLFVEEPLPPEDVEGLAALARDGAVPLAAGERLIGRREAEPLLARRLVSVLQPDICHVGGLTETRKIAAMAELAGVALAPHNPLGPIAGAAALHFAVSSPNVLIQEEMSGAVPWYDDVVAGPIRREGGWWMVPDAPGLGVEVNAKIAALYPFQQEPLIAAEARVCDGTIVDW